MSLLSRIERAQQAHVAQQTVAIQPTQFVDRAVNVLLVTQRQVPIIQTILQTVEIIQRQVPIIQKILQTVEMPPVQFNL